MINRTLHASGRSGGAVLASGIVGLDDCAFVENHAVVGSAVMNTVSVSLSFVDFVNNTLLCDNPGLFLDWNDVSAATCRLEMLQNIREVTGVFTLSCILPTIPGMGCVL